jgi:hypothetical protein
MNFAVGFLASETNFVAQVKGAEKELLSVFLWLLKNGRQLLI